MKTLITLCFALIGNTGNCSPSNVTYSVWGQVSKS
jgi:hypothetical protein